MSLNIIFVIECIITSLFRFSPCKCGAKMCYKFSPLMLWFPSSFRFLGTEQEAVRAVPPSGENDWQPRLLPRQHAGLSSHALCGPGLARCSGPHSLRAGPAAVAHHQTRSPPSASLPSSVQTPFLMLFIIIIILLPAQHLSPDQLLRQSVNSASSLSATPLLLLACLPPLSALPVPSGCSSLPSCFVPVSATLVGNQISWLTLLKQFFLNVF